MYKRQVQDRLDGWWLLFGLDTLITAMPWRMFGTPDGHTIHTDGSIVIGPGWRLAHDRWSRLTVHSTYCRHNVRMSHSGSHGTGAACLETED